MIAKIAQFDNDYQYMVEAIKDKIPTKSIKEDSELKKIEGQFESLLVYKKREGEIIVRDAQEILIPKEYQEKMLKELLTHSARSFVRPLLRTATAQACKIGKNPYFEGPDRLNRRGVP